MDKDNKPMGLCRIIICNSNIYEGYVNEKGEISGFARKIEYDGISHIGWWENTKKHGNCYKLS